MIESTAPKESRNPASKSWRTSIAIMMSAASPTAFSPFPRHPLEEATSMVNAMMVARTTDGCDPEMNMYRKSPIVTGNGMSKRGMRNIESRTARAAATTATFEPDTARMCATPETMNASRIAGDRPPRSPIMRPLRNSPSAPPIVRSICDRSASRNGMMIAPMNVHDRSWSRCRTFRGSRMITVPSIPFAA